MSLVSTLKRIIAPVVEACGFDLVGCTLSQERGQQVLRVTIDSPVGVSLEDCAKISRQVSVLLDVEDPINSCYSLEISSPGLEQPLSMIGNYRRFIGRKVKLLLHKQKDKKRQICGIIKAVEQAKVILETDGMIVRINSHEIARANLVADLRSER